MNKKQKKMLTRIIIAAVLMIAFKVINTFVDIPTVVLFIMYMIPYLVIGYDILRKAIKGILNRQVFDENFLMAVATVGAIIIALVDDGDHRPVLHAAGRGPEAGGVAGRRGGHVVHPGPAGGRLQRLGEPHPPVICPKTKSPVCSRCGTHGALFLL